MEAYQLGVAEAAAAIAAGELSPVELVDSVLRRIDATEGTIGAFACVTAEAARADAAAAEAEIAAGRYRGPLHGIPVGVKDLCDTAGVPTTCSSKVRAGNVPDRDAAVVERLRAAGTVMVGKTHTHEFAFGVITPTTRNPWDPRRIPGGSSGGSAAAVAAGSCLVGVGSDTGGSIRIPSALCGTTGLKPTYGRVSRRGIASLSWSLDHCGPLARSVRDCALVMNAIAGHDPADPGSVDVPVPDFTEAVDGGVAGLRVGVPADFFLDRVSDDVAAATRGAHRMLEGLGCRLDEVTIPHAEAMLATAWAIILPEASAYHQELLRDSADLYQPDVRLLLEVGELVLATDYIRALRVRTLIQRSWAEMFEGIDVLVTPTVPIAAPKVGTAAATWPDGTVEEITQALVRLTVPADLTGLPALSVPAGKDPAGLPLAVQVIGRPFDETTVLRVGAALEGGLGRGGIAPL